jgi:hypothetical protein
MDISAYAAVFILRLTLAYTSVIYFVFKARSALRKDLLTLPE